MAGRAIFISLLFILLFHYNGCDDELTIHNMIDEDALSTLAYVFWPNATVPFYVDSDHFDKEQTLAIMSALAQFAFKTCLKFAPVMAPPDKTDHVLVLENPTATRKCTINTNPHSIEEPHRLSVGYECLHPPQIDMLIMKALGFPFEHNRAVRDIYIQVQPENVEPANLDLFTRDLRLPIELRSIPYDRNSVMHFGERDYSKNGHRTIIFKDRSFRQERYSLSALDLRKIDIVYGPECRKRDRQEKIEICQNYPGVVRRKRELTDVRSLRVNPDITPPPDIGLAVTTEDQAQQVVDIDSAETHPENVAFVQKVIKELGVEKEVENIIEEVHRVGATALEKARLKLCNNTKLSLRSTPEMSKPGNKNILDIIGDIASYAQNLVALATKNITEFCAEAKSLDEYQRSSCPFFDQNKCPPRPHKSTKSGPVKVSTNHRPIIKQHTKHNKVKNNVFDNFYARKEFDISSTTPYPKNATTAAQNRRKRDVTNYRKNTRIITIKKSIYAPRYKAFNDAELLKDNDTVDKSTYEAKVRRKRETDQVQQFHQQRYRAPEKYRSKNRTPSMEQQKQMPEWDDSQLSLEQDDKYKKEKVRSDKARDLKLKLNSQNNSEETTESAYIRPKYISQISLERQNPDKMDPGISNFDKDYKDDHERSKREKSLSKREYEATDNAKTSKKTTKQVKDKQSRDKLHPPRRLVRIRQNQMHSVRIFRPSRAGTEQTTQPVIDLPKTVTLSKKNQEFYNERMWPDNIVRYIIHDESGDFDLNNVRARLDEVNEILKQKTCTRIEEITEEQGDLFEDYLVLDSSPDFVTGRVGGRQNFGVIELLKGGQHRQHTAMMVMAMLGFYFEVSRHDRDKYIRVHMRHVRPDKLHHFEKIRDDATFDLPYDYKSATHPAWQFWRQIGKTGISTVATFKDQDPDGKIMNSLGQNEELLSDYDIIKLNSVYGTECFASSKETKHTTKTGKGGGHGRGQGPKRGHGSKGYHDMKEEATTIFDKEELEAISAEVDEE